TATRQKRRRPNLVRSRAAGRRLSPAEREFPVRVRAVSPFSHCAPVAQLGRGSSLRNCVVRVRIALGALNETKGGDHVQTLVLNVGYQPVARVPWERAIVWFLDRVVEVVDEYPDRYIRSPNWTVRMPSVVRFLKPTPRKKAIKFSRHNVYARDRGRCQYC